MIAVVIVGIPQVIVVVGIPQAIVIVGVLQTAIIIALSGSFVVPSPNSWPGRSVQLFSALALESGELRA